MRRASDQLSQEGPPSRWSVWSGRLGALYTGSAVLFWPITDFVTRLFVALAFFRSGIVKVGDWELSVFLAKEEYPVSWMSAEAAAATGLAIELIGPLLLVLGLMTRPAAVAMALLTIVSQTVYIPTTTNLMLIAMLVWYVVNGPAALSVDAWWVRLSAIRKFRLAKALIALGRFSHAYLSPLVVLMMRVWLGVALLALADLFEPPIWLATWLPISSFSGLPDWVAIGFALLLITGTAASPVSYALVFIVAAFMVVGVHPDVTFYPVLLLGVYEARGAGPLSIDNAIEKWMARRSEGQAHAKIDLDDPDIWLATLKDWVAGGRLIAGKARARWG